MFKQVRKTVCKTKLSICTAIQPITIHIVSGRESPIPIIDQNTNADSYTEDQINKPYIAIKKEIYIFLGHQKLRNCKHVGYYYYCEELCCSQIYIF